jgi:hypothetical protein
MLVQKFRLIVSAAPGLLIVCLLTSCGGGSSDGPSATAGPPTKLSKELQDWSNRNAAILGGADSAIDRAKAALLRVGIKGNAETIQTLADAQTSVQEVATMLNGAAISRQQGDELLAKAIVENQRVMAANAELEKGKEVLEKREHYYSVPIITTLVTTVITVSGLIWAALVSWRVKMVTAHEDKEVKRLEIVERQLRVAKLSREMGGQAQPEPPVSESLDTKTDTTFSNISAVSVRVDSSSKCTTEC